MLQSFDKHEWSPDGGITWYIPEYYDEHAGASALNWPKNNIEGDDRDYLSFWKGYKNRKEYRGGCCTNGYNNELSWGQPFQIFIPGILSIICTESYIYC